MRKLTEEGRTMLRFYWEEKEDITRYASFEEIEPLIKEEIPELLKAWKKYKKSIKRMNAICKTL